jgi:type I restriction enzyme, S subunit
MREEKKLVPKLRFPQFRGLAGWETKPFANLFSIGSGRDHKQLAPGDIPVYGSGGYMRSVDEYLYDGESVCIGRKGTINNPMFLTGKFWTVDTLFYTHSFNQCLPKFIFAIFQNIDWLKHNEAGGVPSLSKTIIEKIEVAIPETREQQKIAECLSSVDELMAAQARKVDALKTHKKGLMQQLFPRAGETQPRLRFPEFQNAGEWEVKRLDELVDMQSGATPSKANPAFWIGSVPWVSAKDMKRLFLEDAEDHISAEAVDDGARLVPRGTLLMLIRGMTLLKDVPICVLRREMSFNQDVKGLRPKNGVDGLFLAWMLTGNKQRLLAMVNVAGHGTGKLDTDELKALELMFPPPPEQQRIATCLSSLDALITAETQKLDALKLHKKGLMQQLFPSPEAVAA